MERQKADDLLDLVIKMGIMLIQSGAETYRVEQTLYYVLKAFDATDISAYVAGTLLIVSFKPAKSAHVLTSSWRVKNKGNNLEKVRSLNNLSYKLSQHNLTLEDFAKELDAIDQVKPYPLSLFIFGGAMIAFGFALMFNRPFNEGCLIALMSVPVMLLYRFLSKQINDFFINSVCSALGTILVIMGLRHGYLHNFAYSLASVLMALMPGALFTNGLRDLTMGDLTAGSNKLTETFLVGVALALGAVFMLLIFNMRAYFIGAN